MEKVIAIVTLVLSIASLNFERISFLFRVLLSCITAFGLYKLYNNKFSIIPIDKYDGFVLLEWFRQFAFASIILTGMCYVFFYKILKMVFRYFLDKLIANGVDKYLKGLSVSEHREYNAFLLKLYRKVYRQYGSLLGIGVLDEEDKIDVYDVLSLKQETYLMLITSIHVVVCWYVLGLNYTNSLLLLLLLLTMYISLKIAGITAITRFMNIFKAFRKEYNNHN